MNNKRFKVQKIFCAFFMALCCLSMSSLTTHGADYKPQDTITISGSRTEIYEGGSLSGYATVTYTMSLIDYNSVTNTARYNVTSSYYLEGTTILHGDSLWINGTHVGDFNSNNGKYTYTQTVYRNETIPITLHSGYNTFETTNIGGVGGDSEQNIFIKTFVSPPKVHATNGVWYEGEVEKGLRTWESIYTDGATGSSEGNKFQTSTGFMYSDVDEQPTSVNSYSDTVIGKNSYIAEIKDGVSGQTLPKNIYAFNNPGTYWVKSCTTDSGGLEGCGVRYITVVERKYNISYNGNGATSGGTSSQTCTVLYDCALNSNGFSRELRVNYNGNGGNPSQTSAIAKSTFLGWMDHNNFTYDGVVYPYWTFNAPFYANYNSDVGRVHGYNKSALIDHWLSTSIKNTNENRQSSEFFNIAHYMTYGGGDLISAFGGNRSLYVNHYTYGGYYEGRNATSPISGQFDTYPDRAVVRNLSLNSANLTLMAKWRDEAVTLPSGTRPGYKLIAWTTEAGSMIGKPGENYKPTANTTVYAKWDKAPTIIANNQTFYEGQYSDATWKSTQRLKGVSASDQEDGNLTSKIKIIEDSTKVNTAGTYKVTYQVTDSVGQTTKKTVTITVKYNNPPVITTKDKTFYEGQYTKTYWQNTLRWQGISANDKEDGNITSKIKVIADTVDVNKAGTYKVTYQVTDRFGKTATKDAKVTVLYNNPPVITTKDKTFYEGQYSKEDWVNTLRMQDVSATDKEDGNLTSKIKVIADTVNVNVPGIYKVTYQVTDAFGKTDTKDAKVTVLYNNPPVLKAEDRWFFVSDDITDQILLERVKASDIEDGDISTKVRILESTVKVHEVGKYQVHYEIIDAFGKSARTSANVYIVENQVSGTQAKRLRFIQEKYLDTLQEDSIWKTGEYQGLLTSTFTKPKTEYIAQVTLTQADIERIKAFNDQYDYSTNSNQTFYEQFQAIWKERKE